MARYHTVGRFAVLLLAAAGLTACGDAGVPPEVASVPPPVTQADAKAMPQPSVTVPDLKVGNSLPVAKALVRMQAHVATSMALHRAGQRDMAAAHIKDALNDDHAADRRTLADLGLDLTLLEWLSAPADQESSTNDLMLARTEAHFDELTYRAGANSLVLTQYALTQMLSRYEAGVAADQPVDMTNYQLAFGMATVANHRASSIKGEAGDALRTELGSLLKLWPEGPLPPQFAATTEQVRDQVNRIRDVLRYAR